MGGAVGQIVAGLALTAVTSFLQTRQAKANKKTRDALIRTRTEIQKNELARQAKMREDAYFQKRRLTEDQDLFTREGDFVAYGKFYYEIVSLSETKQLFGQIDHKFEITAKCIRSREGLFDAS